MKKRFFAAAVAPAAVFVLSAVSAGAVDLKFTGEGVVASALEPGATAAVFSVSRESLPWSVRLVRWSELVADDDGDGSVEIRPERGVSQASVWAVVDLSTGELAIGGPEGSSAREVAFDGSRGLARSPEGSLRRLKHDFESVELLVARPGEGAWTFAASEGGPRDRGVSSDGELEVDLSEADPVGQTESAFDELRAGDVVLGVDPRALRFFAVRFGSVDSEGAR